MNKPVMSFGLSDYNHLSYYEIPEDNREDFIKNKNLKIIENSLGRKFIYKNKQKRNLDYEI